MLFKLSWRNIITKPLSSGLSVLLLASGIIIILITLLTFNQIEEKFRNNAAEIDLVVGAKGSRLQLVLCNIYQVDQPTGNIDYNRTGFIRNHPFVKMTIPLSLGDNYKTYRIVGTTSEYIDSLYKGEIDRGRKWEASMEVVIGGGIASKLGLDIGDEFFGGHGIGESVHSHDDFSYKVVGVLKRNNTVLDNLLLTSLESVWEVHKEEDQNKGSFDLRMEGDSTINNEPKSKEVTSLLVFYKSPRAKFTIPGMANNLEGFMAAEPAIEIQQLIELISPALSVMKSMAVLVIIIAGLSMFIALFNSLKDRKYEIALLRISGASSIQVFSTIITEGLMISFIGFILGTGLSHIGMEIFSGYLSQNYHYDFTGWIWLDVEWYILIGSFLIGMISALYPAIKAYQIDISETLSKN